MNHSNEKNKNGFTLAELLIVVAIIAVLVAISIPIFNKQLEKAREAYDIYTMRQAASAAIELFYAGVNDGASATANGLIWWDNGTDDQDNAAGVYVPSTGKFLPKSSKEMKGKAYGKGTKVDGGTEYTMGNDRGSYLATADYTDAVVMVSIYPKGANKHADIYWKDSNGKYIGDQNKPNDPKYSIRIWLK